MKKLGEFRHIPHPPLSLKLIENRSSSDRTPCPLIATQRSVVDHFLPSCGHQGEPRFLRSRDCETQAGATVAGVDSLSRKPLTARACWVLVLRRDPCHSYFPTLALTLTRSLSPEPNADRIHSPLRQLSQLFCSYCCHAAAAALELHSGNIGGAQSGSHPL